jgi:hypothetical protein
VTKLAAATIDRHLMEHIAAESQHDLVPFESIHARHWRFFLTSDRPSVQCNPTESAISVGLEV